MIDCFGVVRGEKEDLKHRCPKCRLRFISEDFDHCPKCLSEVWEYEHLREFRKLAIEEFKKRCVMW